MTSLAPWQLNVLFWLVLAFLLRRCPQFLTRARVLKQVGYRRTTVRLRTKLLALNIRALQLVALAVFHGLGFWVIPECLLTLHQHAPIAILGWWVIHGLVCCLVLPTQPIHLALRRSSVQVPSIRRWPKMQWALGMGIALLAAFEPRKLALLCTAARLLTDADPGQALASRKCFQLGRSSAACFLWVLPWLGWHAEDWFIQACLLTLVVPHDVVPMAENAICDSRGVVCDRALR